MSPNRANYWLGSTLEMPPSAPVGHHDGGGGMPTSYAQAATMVAGRPPIHSTPSNKSANSPGAAFESPQSTTVQPIRPPLAGTASVNTPTIPPGFSGNKFRSPQPTANSPMANKTPLGRTQSAPQTPQQGNSLLMAFPNGGNPWLSPNMGSFGAPGQHLSTSGVKNEAEDFANSQLNTLCLQMTDSCLGPDFSDIGGDEQHDKSNKRSSDGK